MKSNTIMSKIAGASVHIIVGMAVLLFGIAGMLLLASMRKPPATATYEEQALRVEAIRVYPEDVPVVITGYGDIQSLNIVSIAPEVSGKVVEVHPRLDQGEIIPKGEDLFRIDPRNYEAALRESEATVQQWKTSISRLKKQYDIEQERLKTLERSRDLARAEFERVKRLFEEDNVGAKSGVEAAERAFNQATDQAAQLAQAVELYPLQIREAESNLAAAEAREGRTRADLERCVVRAPFEARVKQSSVEIGQYVMPGSPVLTLADDSVLEIHVPLDSRDARRWLEFNSNPSLETTAWFNSLKQVPCKIRWTEDIRGHFWEGELHRVVEFNQQTRPLTVAVRIPADKAPSKDVDQLPLVEGMFCFVEIPGRTLDGVFRLPRWAVSFKNTVYASVNGRLATVPVEVARTEGEEAFVSEGLKSGDVVITNRLIDPLENSRLEVTFIDAEGGDS